MPQLDSLTYCTQYIWFISIFLFLYLFFIIEILPIISTILKSRNKYLKQLFLIFLKDNEKSVTININKEKNFVIKNIKDIVKSEELIYPSKKIEDILLKNYLNNK